MLKISQPKDPGAGHVLRLEGTLGGAWVQELQGACEAILVRDGRLALDLQGVGFVDLAGAALLESLRADPRVRLERVSAYVAALLDGGAA